MGRMGRKYRIGDLAGQLSTTVEAVRYYEREGLLPRAARTDGNYRTYGDAERERLAFVLHCRALDMTLDEIRRLLALRDRPEQGCDDVNALLEEHIGHVGERIRVLRKLQLELKALRDRCAAPGTNEACGILEGLSRPAIAPRRVRNAGVHGRHGSST